MATRARWIHTFRLLVVGLVLAGMAFAAGGEDHDARNAVARASAALGGEEAWRAIHSMVATGRYTSFGKTLPFRLSRRRPNLYRFEHHEAGFPLVIGFDGRTAWWHPTIPLIAKADWPVEVPVPYVRMIALDAEFEMPFVDGFAKGHRFAWLGETTFEGERFATFEIWRHGDGPKERWFLDPESFLPVLEISEGTYHGYATERYLHFSDYRNVAGVMLPFDREIEIGNDFRTLEVDQVEVNVELDPEVFRRPLPAGMRELQDLAGRWRVEIESRDDPALHAEKGPPDWERSKTVSKISSRHGGSLLEEEIFIDTDRPRRMTRLYSYDRFRKVFRIASFDTFSEQVDVLEGTLDTEGRLVVSDEETDTAVTIGTQTLLVREVLHDLAADSFRLDREVSGDGGASWFPELRLTYHRLEASKRGSP